MALQHSVLLYQYALTPLTPFTWFGLQISSLDLVASFRLCYVLRQLRENLRDEHTKRRTTDSNLPPPEDRSFVRDALTVLAVVYGGEAIAAPLLGVPTSFMFSGVGPLLYILTQALVDALPALPPMGPYTELPLSFLDGHTRAMLVCTLVPPVVLRSPLPEVANSPWALLLASFIVTNGGFFITNLVSFLHPTPLTLTTPAELQPYGWTTTDLWSAPLVTAIYATLTHVQPFWADLHAVLAGILGGSGAVGMDKIAPLDPETARSACALVLAVFFGTRTATKFGLIGKRGVVEKIKTN
ncbi:hypothetical protein L210DRAFT_3614453 [Boletus edulis BED1]|uniref:Uncharacterized protein n=1 Tax=Boletus edulis BED1 TaxID=1328754 RepID=A0AAD4BJ00_BOLED|nr:hypothetical protein L210DRAFT_3614453 [Boletus edulis BED1]